MENRRDWILVPTVKALGFKFGYDVYPGEFNKISGDLALVKLSDPSFLSIKAGPDRIAPHIKKGATITDKIVNLFKAKHCTVLPILVAKPIKLNALSTFARQQNLMLAGRVFRCVDDWLVNIRQERTVNVISAVKKYRTPLLKSLNSTFRDWEAVTITLVNDILVADENLSILSLFDDFLGSQNKKNAQREHSIEVAVLALMIGRKCRLPYNELKEIGLAALIHDIGMVVYEQKLKEMMAEGGQVLEPDIIRRYYNNHALYGAVLLSKKDGTPISGVSIDVRSIVVEHEQKIDGTGPRVWDDAFKDEIENMKLPAKVIYFGDNQIKTASTRHQEIKIPGRDVVKHFMTLSAQILHISELYVTILDKMKRLESKEPHKDALTVMLKQAGIKINGEVFEIFFNHLVPSEYYPEHLIVRLNTKKLGMGSKYLKYHRFFGVILYVKDDDGKRKKVIRLIKDSNGKEFAENVILDLATEKEFLYLSIDDWRTYEPITIRRI